MAAAGKKARQQQAKAKRAELQRKFGSWSSRFPAEYLVEGAGTKGVNGTYMLNKAQSMDKALRSPVYVHSNGKYKIDYVENGCGVVGSRWCICKRTDGIDEGDKIPYKEKATSTASQPTQGAWAVERFETFQHHYYMGDHDGVTSMGHGHEVSCAVPSANAELALVNSTPQ